MSSSEEENIPSDAEQVESDEEELEGIQAWQALGIKDELAQMCIDLKWTKPTKIQKGAIPVAIEGKDVIGLAETGSGKTAAFALPVLQTLLDHPGECRLSVLVLTPTRELAFQIREQFLALGSGVGLSW